MVNFEFLYLTSELFISFGLLGLLILGLFSFAMRINFSLEPGHMPSWGNISYVSALFSNFFNCFKVFLLATFSVSLLGLFLSYSPSFCVSGIFEVLLYGAYDFSSFVGFGKFLVVLTFLSFLTILFVYSEGGNIAKRMSFFLNFEAFFLFGIILLASFLIVSSSNFMVFYINLELQTFVLYILVSFDRMNPRSAEAGLHYLILGSLSTGILLFGISSFYGITSILGFYESSVFFSLIDSEFDEFRMGIWLAALISVLVLFFSFFFKLSMAPFHFWTPEVYEGAPTPVMMLVSVFGKFSILFVFVKILVLFSFSGYLFYPLFSSPYEFEFGNFFMFVGFVTLLFGSVGGLYQSRFKRLWGYSAVANFGFVALALSGLSLPAYAAAILYLTFYIIVNFVFFYAYGLIKSRVDSYWLEPLYLAQFSYFKLASIVAHLIVCFVLVSLLSFPPLLSFLAKFYVLYTVYASSVPFSPIFMGLFLFTNLISSFYYLRLYRFMSVEGQEGYSYNPVFYRTPAYIFYVPACGALILYFCILLYSNTYLIFLIDIIGVLLTL